MPEIKPTSSEKLTLPSGRVVEIPKLNLVLKEWKGIPIKNTYNNKAIVDCDGRPFFAELAILELFKKNGWDGMWVDSYRRKYRIDLPEKAEPIELPPKQQKLIESIKEKTKISGGCWDVFVWKGEEIKFAEAKKTKKDALRENQYLWLEKSLDVGFSEKNFLLVEWDTEKN